jgi:hypothetical protein
MQPSYDKRPSLTEHTEIAENKWFLIAAERPAIKKNLPLRE